MSCRRCTEQNEKRRAGVMLTLTADHEWVADCSSLASASREAEAMAKELDARAKSLREGGLSSPEIRGLRSLRWLAKESSAASQSRRSLQSSVPPMTCQASYSMICVQNAWRMTSP